MAQKHQAYAQIASLQAARSLAIRRADHAGVERISQQITELGGDPETGDMVVPGKQAGNGSQEMAYEDRIQKINENNRRKTKDAMAAAHVAATQRKKAEEAMMKARQ